MNTAKILPVVVLYNSDLQEQLTYKTLLSDERWDFFVVYDNSSSDYTTSNVLDKRAHYFRDINNSGLSVAYNYAAKIAIQRGYDWILILDQDTTFSADAFNEYIYAITRHPQIKLFSPNISLQDGTPFSPSKLSYSKIKGVKIEVGEYLFKDYYPVNSGLCINISEFFKCGGYNENIHLDFSDYYFIDQFRKYNSTFYVININAVQSFSNDERNIFILRKRFEQYTIDFYNYVNTLNPLSRMQIIVLYIRHLLALTIKTKSIIFLKLLINKIINK